MAVAGAGYFARFHYDGWARIPEAAVVANVDVDADKAQSAARQFNVQSTFTSAEDMLDMVQPRLFDIATPPASHAALVRAAADRKIAVICQKAFCTSFEEARATVAYAAERGSLLVIHENFRFQPWYRTTKSILNSGNLGDVYQVSFRLRPGDGQGPKAYLDRQPYFQKMPRFLVRETGIHFIDTFRFLFGEVAGVMARLRRINPAIAGEDAGIILFDFVSGARGLFDGNRLADHAAQDRRWTMGEMLIEGSESSLRLDGHGRLFLREHGEIAETPMKFEVPNVGFAGDSVRALQAHVIDHMLRKAPVENRGLEYLRNLVVEEAIYRSHADGRYVSFI